MKSNPIIGSMGVPFCRYVISRTSLTLANNTAKEVDFVVPAGKRWILLNIKITNPDDVNRVVQIMKHQTSAGTHIVKYYTAGTYTLPTLESLNIPTRHGDINTKSDFGWQTPDICHAGSQIRIYWATGGASAGGTDADGIMLEYLEVNV